MYDYLYIPSNSSCRILCASRSSAMEAVRNTLSMSLAFSNKWEYLFNKFFLPVHKYKYVCMYVSIYVCMYECMYVFICDEDVH